MSGRLGRSRRDSDVPPTGSPLDALLTEMRDLRLTLAADLTAAAGAAEMGADDVASDIVEADRIELARFARVADQRLARLQRIAVARPDAPRWKRRLVASLPAVPIVGALTLSAAAATGVLPLPTSQPHHAARPAVQRPADHSKLATTFQHFVHVVGNHPNASQVIAAAHKLHRELAVLIATTPNNPGGAAEIAQLLQMEQSLLLQAQPPGASVVLDATRKLAARLVHVAPQLTTNPVPTPLPTLPASEHPQHHATPPSTSPSRARTTKPKPSPSPSPSPAPSNGKQSPPPQSSPTPAGFPALPG